MTLKEAREIAKKNKGYPPPFYIDKGILTVFDNRITELEDCLGDLMVALSVEFGGNRAHSVNVESAIEKARQILEGKK